MMLSSSRVIPGRDNGEQRPRVSNQDLLNLCLADSAHAHPRDDLSQDVVVSMAAPFGQSECLTNVVADQNLLSPTLLDHPSDVSHPPGVVQELNRVLSPPQSPNDAYHRFHRLHQGIDFTLADDRGKAAHASRSQYESMIEQSQMQGLLERDVVICRSAIV